MATASVPNTFANQTNADALEVNANFTAVVNFLNTEIVHRDAQTAFTAIPVLPATDPTTANQAARKSYVDAILPTGMIVDYAGSAAPSGWLLCDGSAYNRTTYAALFAVIGTTYGAGDGSTTFNVPDFRGRVAVGAGTGSGLTARTRGQSFGSETATAELISHQHTIDHDHGYAATYDANHDHTHGYSGTTGTENQGHKHSGNESGGEFVSTVGGTGAGILTGGSGYTYQLKTNFPDTLHNHNFSGTTGGASSATHAHGIDLPNFTGSSGWTGSNTGHPNVQPSLVANKIIRF